MNLTRMYRRLQERMREKELRRSAVRGGRRREERVDLRTKKVTFVEVEVQRPYVKSTTKQKKV